MLWYEKEFTDQETGEFMYETNPVKAIRNKCRYDCCAGDQDSWKNCTCTKCFLYPFRLGKNPYRQPRTLSAEHLEKLQNGLKSFKS